MFCLAREFLASCWHFGCEILGELGAILRIEVCVCVKIIPLFCWSCLFWISLHAAEETLSWAGQFSRLMEAQPQCTWHHLFIPLASVVSGGVSEPEDSASSWGCWEKTLLPACLGGGLEEKALLKSTRKLISTRDKGHWFFFPFLCWSAIQGRGLQTLMLNPK